MPRNYKDIYYINLKIIVVFGGPSIGGFTLCQVCIMYPTQEGVMHRNTGGSCEIDILVERKGLRRDGERRVNPLIRPLQIVKAYTYLAISHVMSKIV